MNDLNKLVRAIEEFEKCGGDPKVLFDKLSSNLILSEQNEHLTRTRAGIQAGISQDLEGERVALLRRDDALEATKIAEKQLDSVVADLAKMLGTTATAEAILQKIGEAEGYLTKLNLEKEYVEEYITPGRWLLGVLGRHPNTLRNHRDRIINFLNQPASAADFGYTDEISKAIIELALDEIIRFRGLVPRTELVMVKAAADDLNFQRNWIIKPFLRAPTQLTLEQRRCLIGAFIDSGLTRENFEEYRQNLATSWRKCPIHKDTDLRVNPSTLKWQCTYTGCKYAE